MARVNAYPNVTRPAKADEILVDGTGGTRNVALSDLAVELLGMSSVDMHRNFYRGKNLGTSYTAAQKAAIANGSFDDLFVGDYWTLGGKVYRIVDLDYWYNTGDTACTIHHAVVMPDANMYTHVMNDTNITTTGYTGSKMYTEGLEDAKETIDTAFGASFILQHRELLVNAGADGHASAGGWVDSKVEIPNEIMIYGSYILTAVNTGTTVPYLYTCDKTQLAAFRLRPQLITNRATWWLRDIVSAASFAIVTYGGGANYLNASSASGVRPVFGIHG